MTNRAFTSIPALIALVLSKAVEAQSTQFMTETGAIKGASTCGHPSPIAMIPDAWWCMPEGMGALLGSLVGLLAVALSAVFGFWQLKKGQIRQAEIHRKAEDSRRLAEAQALAAVLRAELDACSRDMRRCVEVLRKVQDRRPRSSSHQHPTAVLRALLFPVASAPVFGANTDRLGILGASLAHSVVHVYRELLETKRLADTSQQDDLDAFAGAVSIRAEVMGGQIRDIGMVCRRLEAFEKEGKDPSPEDKPTETIPYPIPSIDDLSRPESHPRPH